MRYMGRRTCRDSAVTGTNRSISRASASRARTLVGSAPQCLFDFIVAGPPVCYRMQDKGRLLGATHLHRHDQLTLGERLASWSSRQLLQVLADRQGLIPPVEVQRHPAEDSVYQRAVRSAQPGQHDRGFGWPKREQRKGQVETT